MERYSRRKFIQNSLMGVLILTLNSPYLSLGPNRNINPQTQKTINNGSEKKIMNKNLGWQYLCYDRNWGCTPVEGKQDKGEKNLVNFVKKKFGYKGLNWDEIYQSSVPKFIEYFNKLEDICKEGSIKLVNTDKYAMNVERLHYKLENNIDIITEQTWFGKKELFKNSDAQDMEIDFKNLSGDYSLFLRYEKSSDLFYIYENFKQKIGDEDALDVTNVVWVKRNDSEYFSYQIRLTGFEHEKYDSPQINVYYKPKPTRESVTKYEKLFNTIISKM